MVSHPGTPVGPRRVRELKGDGGASGFRRLNEPHPAAVEANPRGEPIAVLWHGIYRRIAAVHDSWRIDDEWWREEIARRYYLVELADGRRLTLYRDLRHDAWFAQPYDGPRAQSAG